MLTNKQYHKNLFVLRSTESPQKPRIITLWNDIKRHKRRMYALSGTEERPGDPEVVCAFKKQRWG